MLYLSDADLSNAVSLNMISDFPVSIKVQEIDIESATLIPLKLYL